MNADIDATGRLTIKAETDIEQYALAKWWEDWQQRKVCLQVEITHESCPGAATFKQVRNEPFRG